MICSQCGNIVGDNEKFCSRCGATVNTTIPVAPVQPQYNPYSAPVNDGREVPMTTGQYIGLFILTSWFGLISLILCIVWAFSADSSQSKKNFCKAMLIIQLIAVGASLIFMIIFFAAIANSAGSINEWLDSLKSSSSYYNY